MEQKKSAWKVTWAIWLLACLAAQSPAAVAGNAAPPRPNIVIIMADDMGYSDIGSYGGEIETPNLDSLAGGGIRFTNAYNTARCWTSRASLLTGLYLHRSGIDRPIAERDRGMTGPLSEQAVTLAQVLQKAGYATFASGKWHLGGKSNAPLARGFDHYFGFLGGAASYFTPRLHRDNDVIPTPEGFYLTDGISDEAARFLEDHSRAGTDRPFFLYVAYTAPHWPLHALEEDIAKYEGKYDAGWDVLRRERYGRVLREGLIKPEWRLSERPPDIKPWSEVEDKEWFARRMEVYAAQIDRMDQGIGRILGALKRLGYFENTLILFLSDNGGCAEELEASAGWVIGSAPKKTRAGLPMTLGNDPSIMPGPENTFMSYGLPWANASNTPFRFYKARVHEGGVATPLIAHWPAGIRAKGELRSQMAHVVDLTPTCLDIAGVRYPKEFGGRVIRPADGVSLTPAFAGRALDRDVLYFEHLGFRAVITKRWKLVSKPELAQLKKVLHIERADWELYDIQQDRTELHDAASEHPAVVARLAAMWERWAEKTSGPDQ